MLIARTSHLFQIPPYRSGYYNLYNYEFFFVMVNEAIKEAFIGLQEI
jgi:hypothetical protein